MKSIFYFLFVSLLLSPISGVAVEVNNLYKGKVLVTDKTRATRIKSHRRAMSQVIAKVSGDKNVLRQRQVQNAINLRSANYIKSFEFITDDQDRLFLVDEFDQTKIDGLLKSVGAAIWGKRRPNTLIWLVKEEGFERTVVENEFNPQISDYLKQSADDRGLPILLPKMDITDKENIYSSDIWARFYQPVRQASARYQVDNIVLARMRYVTKSEEPDYDTGWLLEFEIIDENTKLHSASFNGEQFDVIRQMTNDIGNYFAEQYAVTSESLNNKQLVIEVTPVVDVINVVAVEQLLNSLTPVTQVLLTNLAKGQAKFQLEIDGEPLDVIKALALLPEFTAIESATIFETEKETKQLSIEQQLAVLDGDPNQVNKALLQASEMEQQAVILKYRWAGK